jgi:hypothetical protein
LCIGRHILVEQLGSERGAGGIIMQGRVLEVR